MREVKYLSPTSISTWKADRTEFFFRYLADDRPERLPQTRPMSVGSAFDAYVKAYLVERLFKSTDVDGVDYSLEHLFEQQVEPHNRDWAWVAGREAMELYRASGALADLCLELDAASSEPRFEFKVEGRVSHQKVTDGVPFLGRPDLYFTIETRDSDGRVYITHVIIDWKVNGWCARRAPSPVKGYKMCRTWRYGLKKEHKAYLASCMAQDMGLDYGKGAFVRSQHKDAVIMRSGGIEIDVAHKMEELNLGWATQETIYAWVLGVRPGEEFVCGIDQLVGRSRVSSLRNRVSSTFQLALLTEAADIWTRIRGGFIFDEDNEERIEMLSAYAEGYRKDDSEHRDWLEGIIRGRR